ncbi:MAG TPA: hydroxyisourate hydrolase [Gemmatimonadaceae bacterium]|nr:hydroxyisourate hydrolase [Gemmatimonadaceae bacterium]
MSTLSTHVLDIALGQPAQGIRVTLERSGDLIGSGTTDADGRLRDLQKQDAPLSEGTYQLTFYVGEYFSKAGREFFFPEVVVNFRVAGGAEHYHVPLLLSPFGYSTYRGS